MTNNPLTILLTLDRHLGSAFDLYIYGRSALALGYPDSPLRFFATMDVDAILPAAEVVAIEQNADFWRAQQKTNDELGDSGLYFTHLFEDRQVILRPDWLEHTVPIRTLGFRKLRLFRPSTVDLILTKMMRIDPDDREDRLLAQPDYTRCELQVALHTAAMPPIPETREAFEANHAWLAARIPEKRK